LEDGLAIGRLQAFEWRVGAGLVDHPNAVWPEQLTSDVRQAAANPLRGRRRAIHQVARLVAPGHRDRVRLRVIGRIHRIDVAGDQHLAVIVQGAGLPLRNLSAGCLAWPTLGELQGESTGKLLNPDVDLVALPPTPLSTP